MTKLRLHYCTLKSGRDVGVGEVGAGFQDFLSSVPLIEWLQGQTAAGITVAVLAIREM